MYLLGQEREIKKEKEKEKEKERVIDDKPTTFGGYIPPVMDEETTRNKMRQ